MNRISQKDIEQLWEKAKTLEEQGVPKEAILIYEQLLEQSIEEKFHWEVAFHLVDLCKILGKENKAIKVLEALEKHNLPIEIEVNRLRKLFVVERQNTNFEIAHQYILKCYQLAKEHITNELTLLTIRKDIAFSMMFTNPPNYKLSAELLEELVQECSSKQQPEFQTILLFCYEKLIRAYYCINEIKKSEHYFHLGVELNKTVKNYYIEGQICLMYFYIARKKSTKLTLEILQQATACFKKHYKRNWTQTLDYGYVNLWYAILEIHRQDLFEALYYLKMLENITKEIDNHYLSISVNYQYAHAYSGIKDYKKAAYYAHKTYDIEIEKFPNSFVLPHYLCQLGESYININQVKAHNYYKKALEQIEEQDYEKNTTIYQICYEGLIKSCKALETEDYVNKLLKHVNIIEGLSLLKSFYYVEIAEKYLSFDTDAAIHYAIQSLNLLLINKELNINELNIDWQNDVGSFSHTWNTITILAQAYFKRYQEASNVIDLKQSVQCFKASIDILNTILNSYKAEGSKLSLNEQLPKTFGTAIKALTLLEPMDYLTQTFQFIEAGKAKVLQAGLTEGRAKKLLEGSPLYVQEQELKGELQALEIQIEQSKESNKETEEKRYQHFFAKRKEYQELTQQMEETYPEYKRLKYQNTVLPLQQIQEQLSENQLLLNYFLTAQTLFIQFVSEDETEIVEIPIDENFPELVKRFARSIRHLNLLDFYQYTEKLSKILISPIADLILDIFGYQELKQLIIIPHAHLSQIPFETLLTSPYVKGEQPKYLIHQFDVSYHYSASLWCLQQKQKSVKTANYDFLGMAPVYEKETIPIGNRADSKTENNEWDYLPFSENEVKELSQLFEKNQAKCFVKKEASKITFLAEVNQAKIVHLAAHFHQHERPKLSGLVFENDEKLYIQEAFNLDLSANLFVLSACESAVGQLYKSEGMMAINRGLLYSGVQNIVSALFVVNDNQAYEFMLHFYKSLLTGKNVVNALGEAKRILLAKNKEILPIHWASFVLIGG